MNIRQKERIFFFTHAITILSLFTYSVCDEKVKIKSQKLKVRSPLPGPILKFARDSLERSRRSNGRVERNGKLVFSSSFDLALERHLVYDLYAVLPSRSFHLQANQQPSLIER